MTMCRICVCCFSLILLIISIGIIGISLYIHLDFAQIMENRVKAEMIIKEENAFYEDWLNSKTVERTNFYVFEVVNPKEILNGLKPKVKEVGPFVFRVERIKEKVTFSFDKTLVSYVERKVYHFIEMMSSADIDHKITVVNLQFMVLNPLLSHPVLRSSTNNSVINSIFETFGSNVFVSKSVREILFGSKTDPQIDKISQSFEILSKSGIPAPKLLAKDFSIFSDNSEQKFEVFTGYKTGLYGRVLKWNDKSSVSVWTSKSCNQINGSHGMHSSPLIDKNDRIYEYSTEMCRSIEMSFNKHLECEGIPLFRYIPSSDVFLSPFRIQKNKCYCLSPEKPEKCNFRGILDLSSCTSGAPLILSNPHFMGASQVIAKSVVGLSADEELHQTFIEIEPITGLVIHRKRRYQYNVHIKKCPLNQNSNNYLKESVIPMVWFEEVSERDQTIKDMIRLLFVYPTQYEELIALALIGLAAVLMITSLCCCCCCGKKKKIDPISSQEKVSDPPIKTMSDQTSENRVDLSHNYDQIFKGQTTLNRLKDNPLKRPSTVRHKTDTILTAPSLSSPPPPPPPPPPPQLVPIRNSISDSPQNLLKDIRIGTQLKKVDKKQDFETNSSESIVSISNANQMSVQNSVQNYVQKGPIMTSLAKELEERMRRKSLDNYSGISPQSYYRWHNTDNQTNCSIFDRRASFKEPPVPLPVLLRRPSIDNKPLVESNDIIDSDFSDSEEADNNYLTDDRLKLFKSLKNSESKFAINRSKSLSLGYNQSIKSHSIITDIYHIVN